MNVFTSIINMLELTYLIDNLGDLVLLTGIIAFLLLLSALPFSFWAIVGGKRSSLVRVLVGVANLFLASLLALRWFESGHFPISNLYESLCFLTWSCTLLQLILERSWPSPIVPSILTPFSLLTLAFASFALPDQLKVSQPLVPALKSSWLVMHVSVIMCSYAALLIGSLLSFAVLLVNRSETLRIMGSSVENNGPENSYFVNKQSGSYSVSLPITFTNSEYLDNLSYRTITVGFLLLTFGLISGAVWANEAWGAWWSWDPKETWAFISWLVYAAYLHSRITRGWQGRKPAIIALLGLLVIIICYLGVNLLGVGLHSYGWFFG